MALPSSPPLLPELDLPEVAPSADLPLRALAASSSSLPHSRKRQLSDYGSLSSDPLFSDTASDTDQEGVEEQPRRKRLLRGPWWNLRTISGRDVRLGAMKKSMRVADSGVWMGSDDSIDDIISSQQQMQKLDVQDAEKQTAPPQPQVPDAETLAARFIQQCLEDGKETVDLSDLGLASLSDTTLRPLHQLIRHNHAEHTHPPSEDELQPLTPSIQLYLSRNALRSLPPELFTLTNITVLSLRGNKLTELSPSIAHLRNLKELNVASNRLQYLPWELFGLIQHRTRDQQIHLRPNPLVQPTDLTGPSPLGRDDIRRMVKGEDFSRFADTRATYQKLRAKCLEEGCLTLRTELELRLRLGRLLRIQYLQDASRAGKELHLGPEELIYLASSAIRYFDIDGTPLRVNSGSTSGDQWSAVLNPKQAAPPAASSSSAPSLFELALRKLQLHANLQDLVPLLPDSDLSPKLTSAIQRAAHNDANHGNESCTTCGRKFVVARAEWVEHWFNGYASQDSLTPETVLPFLRRACSWACAGGSEVGEFRC